MNNPRIQVLELNQPEDRGRWNAFVAESSYGHFMQTWEWGEFKSRMGWKPVRLGVEREGVLAAGAQVLFRSPSVLPWSMAYIPKGPMLDIQDDSLAAPLFEAIHRATKKERAIFLKIEPDFLNFKETHDRMAGLGFRPVHLTNQPRCTIILDLDAEDRELLQRMDRNARRLIRRSEDQGVRIEEGRQEEMDAFYEVMAQTSRMKKIPLHEKRFFEEAFAAFKDTGIPKLFIAKCGEVVVGALLVFAYGNASNHLWAGNSPEGRKLSASYLLHWTAIKWAKEHGFPRTDLWGVPDEIADLVEQGESVPGCKEEGLWGVYRFKKSFGGRIQCYIGAYDYVYRPALYRMFEWISGKKKTMDDLSSMIERVTGGR